ncbi:hypothetical protein [Candidatus Lucifugimonas marina]|uniref:Uncharacterized protein n=1 Tax=Candidatus Lucifugimonas marina TaxID=3038979 RepID=A0AAJ5ZHD6_9CHLR|nr:hypothetical protein [SAR202 cluster bacterium JH702]MDG0869446.1 hypothetical protein [SAR202 cluster bacterium JH639]WFG34189.1 hypothetical protein GKN94_00305 [SAR202 cluster bacterium JH545]WFG38118.1 hypothetical protein GKO48_00315 [SAR202 cluster bacterium JH1073]
MASGKKHDTVTALAEEAATGEIAKIFADIRHLMEIPMLTSIWRILAESESDLASTWAAIKPMYLTGQPEAALERLRSDGTFPELEPLTQSELEKADIRADDLHHIRSIIAAYTRSNSLNFLTQTALVSTPEEPPIDYPKVLSTDSIGDIPRLLPREEIADPVWELVLSVNMYGTNEPNPGLATIYRHLAYWPSMLELMQSRLETAQSAGAIALGAQSVIGIALEEGARMAHLRDESHFQEMSDDARSTVAHYVDGPFNVARVVNIGTAITRWLSGVR